MTPLRIASAIVFASALFSPERAAARESDPLPGGELRIIAPGGEPAGVCPLRHTDVRADVTGLVGRVRVRQEFYNPLDRRIEAVYVFPLPQHAAVDHMTMTVGDRRIVGQIKPRDDARRIYDAARAAGHVAGLLDQERPNIFTQSLANIEPGVEVLIEISYVETLKYEDGLFEFVFPMVVGPRYIPGGGSAPAPMTPGRPTPQVSDGHRITPPVTPPGTRAGHDISLTVNIDAGMEIAELSSVLHRVDVARPAAGHAVVTLKNQAEIPNRDFILRYSTAGDRIGDAFFTHTDSRGTFFTVLLQPPQRIIPANIVPREIIFVLDTSGSMNGFPIEKAKQVMARAIDAMRPGDTFNLITFAGDTHILWGAPRPNNAQNRAEAQAFLASRRGRGGTEMMKAILAALEQGRPRPRRGEPAEPATPVVQDDGRAPRRFNRQPMRIVCFMTDGYVGNDLAIIDAVRQHAATTRVFSFGVGNSVNRFLLDGMAQAGRGEVEYVSLQTQADAAVDRFCTRISAPVLADIEIDWGSLQVDEVYPRRIPDLFSVKPIMIHGRLQSAPTGTITLRGRTGAGPFERRFDVAAAATAGPHDALASLWARARIDDLMMRDYTALQQGRFPEPLRDQITALGVDYRLMTQFTSFVAVEEMRVTVGGELTTLRVPVEMPDGVSYEGVFGGTRGAGIAVARTLSARKGGFVRESAGGQAQGMVFSAVESAIAPPSRAAVPGSRAGGPRLGTVAAERMHREQKYGQIAAHPAVTPRVIDAAAPPSNERGDKSVKLAPVLIGLSAKVDADGNLTDGPLRVIHFMVDVRLYLRDLSDATLKTLKDLGFVEQVRALSVRMIIGTIDVRKLEALAGLDAVIHVAPVSDR